MTSRIVHGQFGFVWGLIQWFILISIDFLSCLFYELSGEDYCTQSLFCFCLFAECSSGCGCFFDYLYFTLTLQIVNWAWEIRNEIDCIAKWPLTFSLYKCGTFTWSPEFFHKNEFPLTYVLNAKAYYFYLRCTKLI